MKSKNIFLIFGLICIISGEIIVNALTPINNYQTNTSDQCTSPTVERFIGVVNGTVSYNTTTIDVPKNSCVKFVFENSDPNIDHTFTINANSTINVTQFNIYVQAGSTGTSNFLTPNLNVTLEFYCAIPGHYAAGMSGKLIVGLGTQTSSQSFSQTLFQTNSNDTISTTDFSTTFSLIGLLFILIIVKKRRKVV